MKEHLCIQCLEECSDEFKVVLPSGRIVFFCCDECLKAWKIAKNLFLKMKGQK